MVLVVGEQGGSSDTEQTHSIPLSVCSLSALIGCLYFSSHHENVDVVIHVYYV